MPPLVRAAVLLMFVALACYSLGVWSAFLTARMRSWHVALYWLGLSADTLGTELMRRLAGGIHWSWHTATGAAALALMLAHALWATAVLIRRHEPRLRSFPRISVFVWAAWLVPFVTGLLLGRQRGH